jgi:UDP-glucose 4-epimerase
LTRTVLLRGARTEPYRYEHALEEFLRYSPSVRPHARAVSDRPERRNIAPRASGMPLAVDDLDAAEIIALLPSLDDAGLRALHAHEIANRRRRTFITAIERLQRWEAQP